jgi:hypothetical protein
MTFAIGAGFMTPGRGQKKGQDRNTQMGGQMHGSGIRSQEQIQAGHNIQELSPVRCANQIARPRAQARRKQTGQFRGRPPLRPSAQEKNRTFPTRFIAACTSGAKIAEAGKRRHFVMP